MIRKPKTYPTTMLTSRLKLWKASGNKTSPASNRFKGKEAIALIAGLFATTTVFGQTTQIWTGGNGTGTAIGATTNWLSGASPNSANGDICQWDGTVPGNVFLTSASANGSFNNGTPGVSFYIAAGHTGSWNLRSIVAGGSANIALNATTIDSGAGAYSLGDNTANILNIILRPSSSGNPIPVHTNLNNSANAATINPNVRYQAGGGNPHSLQFDGTGDWIVNNALNNANAGNNNNFLIKRGSGNMFWNANSIAGAAGVNGIGSPIDIEGGRLVLTASTTVLSTQRITNNATLEYGAAGSQTLSGPFDGTGQLVVSAGTLTLSSSQSDWTGNILLTNGGVLVVNGTQNPGGTGPLGVNSTISFNGGTLQFSVANTFDYSPNFSTAAGQAYSINSGGQNVTLTNALMSSGGSLTKLGSGTLTLTGANTYGGTTTVGAGKLILQGTAGTGAIIVANSTVLGVNQGGAQITPAALTVGTSSSGTLEFNNVTSTTTPAIAAAGAVTAGGPITVNVNGGSFTIGQSYPLFSWGSGSAPAVTLGTLTGAGGTLVTNGNTIKLNITSLAFVWSGLNNSNWDLTSANNWKVNGLSQVFANGGTALFDDTLATANTNVVLNATVLPASTTVNSSAKPYTIASSATAFIGGTGSLTKNGSSTLTLSGGANTYTGATVISGGTLSVGTLANGGTASDIGSAGSSAANLVLNGGTLQLNASIGTATSDRLFTLGTANGAIDDESSSSLTLNNKGAIVLSGAGARTLTLTGNGSDELDATIGDNGGATSLAKGGSGTWVLAGNNSNSGTVTIAAGTLQVGNGGASGSIGSGNIVDNGTLDFNTTSTLTNGTIIGTGAVTVDGGGTIILPGNNNYSGTTTINWGTLQIGNGGASGTLNNGAAVVDNDTLIYNSTSTSSLNGQFGAGITGSGNVIVRKGTLQAIGNNSYAGWTEIDPGATFQACSGPVGKLASSVVTNNGTLLLIRQDNNTFIYNGDIVGSGSVMKACNNGNNGDVTLLGNNKYTGGTYIIGGSIIFGDNSTPGAGAFIGDVFLTNDYAHNQFGGAPNDFVPATLVFNRPDDFTFPGNIVGEGFVTITGAGTVTLTGNNTYHNRGTGNPTTISSGKLQIGNGGTSGSIGDGAITDNSELDFNLSSSVTYTNVISGGGMIVQLGSGTTTLTGANTYLGSTVVSNGTLVVGGPVAEQGDLDVEGGVLVSGGVGLLATNTVAGSLNIDSGSVLITLNKSAGSSNTTFVVGGAINATGGSLVLTNFGPALVVGDKFTIFNQPVTGTGLTIKAKGFTVSNNLAVDGSVTVASVVPVTSPKITATVVGGVLNLAWPTGSGLHLQAQTNSLAGGLSNNWVNVSGVTDGSYLVTPNPGQPAVFYRLSQ